MRRQAFSRAVGRPASAEEGVEPVVGPHPEPAGAVLAERQHRRPEEDRAPGHGREPVAREERDLAAARAHPEPSPRRGRHRVHVLVGEPLRPPVGDRGAVLDLHEPDTSDPEASLAVLEDGPDRVGADAVRARQDLHPPVVHAVKASISADPDAPLPVAPQRSNVAVAQRHAVGNQAPAGEAIDPVAIGADPQPAGGVDGQRAHRGRALLRREAEAFERARAMAEAARGADPDAALAVADQAPDGVVDEPVLLREAREGLVVEAVEPVTVGADPQVAVRVLGEGADRSGGEPLAAGVRAERDAAVDADPERPVARHVDGLHVVGAHGRRRPAVEHGEAHAVEPRQPLLRREPEITVGGLGDPLHQVVGKTGVDLPRGQAELAHGLAGLESPGREGAQEDEGSHRGDDARDAARVLAGHEMRFWRPRVAHRRPGFNVR